MNIGSSRWRRIVVGSKPPIMTETAAITVIMNHLLLKYMIGAS